MQQAAELGLTGIRRDQMGSDIRALSYRNRIIHFQVTFSHIHVIRILHGRRDISTDDFPESET